jgi:predicted ATPase/class 3 adenylate cyclase
MMSEMPRGTVIFLFTDIEGSTALWEQDRAAMQAAVERHLALLRQTIEQHGGVLFKTVGDAVQAAFASAPEALLAAVTAQRALVAAEWGPFAAFPVRVALHAGSAAPADGDYLAPSLNRLSRLLLVSHGGQIVLTETVRRLLDGALPPDAKLRDLGEHRLRDLLEPERVWQVVAPGLRVDFPPLRTPSACPHNMPIPPTPLIGRETEVAAITRLFREGARLVTLAGPGGTGKTRLALDVAAELLDDFPDGVWFLELAALTDPALLLPQIAATLGVRESGEQSVTERLAESFANRRVLLVLDNLEQFQPHEALGRAVADLLTVAPGLAVLGTSRAPLKLRGEREVPVSPLSVPAPRATDVATLAASPAVQLFVARAQAVRPGFGLTAQNAVAIAALCRRLDGLPLALELAAARVRVLSPADILRHLGDRLDLLADSSSDRPDRQRTLEATVAWSFDLLTSEQQAAFRRLSVFAGGASLEAADALLRVFTDAPMRGLDAVSALVEQGLLRDEEQADGSVRFRMLGTVRVFGLERLRACGEEDRASDAHAAYFRDLVQGASSNMVMTQTDAGWLDRLEVEHDNLRAALERTAVAGGPHTFLTLAVNCWHFWWSRGYWTEGRMWLERALGSGGQAATSERANALRALGLITDATGERPRGMALVEESQRLFQAGGDRHGEWQTLLDLSLLWASRDYGEAGRYAERALAAARTLGDPALVARSLNRLGNWRVNREEPHEALPNHREALSILEALGDKPGVAETLDLLGMATALSADSPAATRWYARAIPLWREMGDRQGLAASLVGSAMGAYSYHGDIIPVTMRLDEARRLADEGLAISREIGWRAGESYALWGYHGLVLGAAGDYATALPSAREGLSIAREIDHPQWITGARYVLGTLYADLGDMAAAEGELRSALALAEEIASPYWSRSVAGKLVSVLACGGRGDAATAMLDEHLGENIPMDTVASRILWSGAADLALARGDHTSALTIADRLIHSVPGAGRGPMPRLDLLRGNALTALERHADADGALAAAHDGAVWCGARPLQWRILAAQGRLEEAEGRSDDARRSFALALSLVTELAEAMADDALRAVFVASAQQDMRLPPNS